MAQTKKPSLFISFRWKSWIFLSVVFGSVFFLYITLSEQQLRTTYEQQREELKSEKMRNFNLLISQMQGQLTESASLVANDLKTQSYLANPNSRKTFESSLTDLHLEMGLGGLALYSQSESKLVYLNLAPRLDPFIQQHTTAYTAQAQLAIKTAKPQLSLICSTRCEMLIAYPVLLQNQVIGSLMMTRSYQSTFALLPSEESQYWVILQPNSPALPETDLDTKSFLIETNLHSAAAKEILRSAHQKLYVHQPNFRPKEKSEIVKTASGIFEVLYIPLGIGISLPPYALSIHEVTPQIQQLVASKENTILLGALLSLIALFLTSWIVKTPLNRLTRLSKILPEMAELNYKKVKELASTGKRLGAIKDEFYLIETSSVALANELEVLHDQLMNNINALDGEKKLIEQLINAIPMLILVTNLEGEILSKNHYANRYLSRVRLNKPNANNLNDMIELKDKEGQKIDLDLAQISQTEASPYEVEAKLSHESNQIYLWRITPISKQENQPDRMLAIALNITEQKQKESILRVFANQDSLTKLLNRRAFDQGLAEQIQAADVNERSVTLIYIDLNKFKQVNDIAGHAKGDEMLVAVSTALKKSTRDSDLVARLGGDEFAVLLIGADCHSAEVVCNEIIKEVSQIQVVYEERTFPGSVSLGLVCYPDRAENAADLMHKADVAMYHSKKKGEMCFVVYEDSLEQR